MQNKFKITLTALDHRLITNLDWVLSSTINDFPNTNFAGKNVYIFSSKIKSIMSRTSLEEDILRRRVVADNSLSYTSIPSSNGATATHYN